MFKKFLVLSHVLLFSIFLVSCNTEKKEVGLYDHLTPQSKFFKENKASEITNTIGKLRIIDGLAEAVYFKLNGDVFEMDGSIDAETKATAFHKAGEVLRKLEVMRASHPNNIKMSKDVVELYFVSGIKEKKEIPEIMMKTVILDDKLVSYNEWEYLRVDLPSDDRLYYGTYLVKVYDDEFDADQSNAGRKGNSKIKGTAKWDPSDLSITYTLKTTVDGEDITLEAQYKYKRVYVDYDAYATTFYTKGYENYHFGNK